MADGVQRAASISETSVKGEGELPLLFIVSLFDDEGSGASCKRPEESGETP